METAEEMRARIVNRAAEDADFRTRLLDDPKGALEEEMGIAIPASMSVEVHEESVETAHLVLPPDGRLGEGDLQAAAGGTFDPTLGGYHSASSPADW